jgi:hypothetical protein
MNSYDKSSLYEMSYAFMRRFAFIHVPIPSKITPNLIKKYFNCWGEKDLKNQLDLEALTNLWEIINKSGHKIGPAIIEDICKHLKTNEKDYVSAIIMYVLPQFEGLPGEEIKKFIKEIKGSLEISEQDSKELDEFAFEFFDIQKEKEETEK